MTGTSDDLDLDALRKIAEAVSERIIAAFDPPTVLALIALARDGQRLRELRDGLTALLDDAETRVAEILPAFAGNDIGKVSARALRALLLDGGDPT